MADNDILIDGKAVATKDRSNVRWQLMLPGQSITASVIVSAVTTSSSSPAIPADTSTRREIAIKNTGSVTIEVSPTASFGMGTGMPLAPNESMATGYNGAIYARVASGSGELRAWSEA